MNIEYLNEYIYFSEFPRMDRNQTVNINSVTCTQNNIKSKESISSYIAMPVVDPIIVTRYLVIMKDCAALNISGKLPCVILTSGTHHQYPASTEKQYTVSIQLSCDSSAGKLFYFAKCNKHSDST